MVLLFEQLVQLLFDTYITYIYMKNIHYNIKLFATWPKTTKNWPFWKKNLQFKKNILRWIYSKKYGVGSYDNNQSYIIDRVLTYVLYFSGYVNIIVVICLIRYRISDIIYNLNPWSKKKT